MECCQCFGEKLVLGEDGLICRFFFYFSSKHPRIALYNVHRSVMATWHLICDLVHLNRILPWQSCRCVVCIRWYRVGKTLENKQISEERKVILFPSSVWVSLSSADSTVIRPAGLQCNISIKIIITALSEQIIQPSLQHSAGGGGGQVTSWYHNSQTSLVYSPP